MYPSDARYAWEFERDGEAVAFNPTGPIALDDHELMVQVALSGVALPYVWENRAERDIAYGSCPVASMHGARPRIGCISTIRAAETCRRACAPEGEALGTVYFLAQKGSRIVELA